MIAVIQILAILTCGEGNHNYVSLSATYHDQRLYTSG